MLVTKQTRCTMRNSGAGISHNVLLYNPAGITLTPAKLACNNVHNKLSPIPLRAPPRQATFFDVQSVPVADGSGRFVTICAPPCTGVPVPGSTHGGLAAPIKHGDEVNKWKEMQCARECFDVVVKDRELSQAEKVEMEKRVCEWESKTVCGLQVYTCNIVPAFLPCSFICLSKAEVESGLGAACMHLPGAVV
ncbi:hypothetical protein FRC12_017297, partial [Ceratobasidium sp. 428]